MTEQQPDETRVHWVPEIADPIDLRDAMEIVQNAAPWDQDTLLQVCRAEDIPEPEEMPLGPEGTLTEVYDGEDGRLIGHAEAIYNNDGTGALKIYGINHNPEEQP